MTRPVTVSDGNARDRTYHIVGTSRDNLATLLRQLLEDIEKGSINPYSITLDNSGSDTFLIVHHDYRSDSERTL